MVRKLLIWIKAYKKRIISFLFLLVLGIAQWKTQAISFLPAISSQLLYDPGQLQNIKIKDHYKVAIFWAGGTGDLTEAKVAWHGTQNLHWESILLEFDDPKLLSKLWKFNPDFVIVIGICNYGISYEQYYQYLRTVNTKIYPIVVPPITRPACGGGYDGYIVHSDQDQRMNLSTHWKFIRGKFAARDNSQLNYILSRDTLIPTKFQLNNYRNLVVVGTRWDKLRNSDKYTVFLSILASKGYLNIYGPEDQWRDRLLKSYWRGYIKKVDALQKIYQKNGIALVMHSEGHLREGLVTMRIIEPIAAGAVVICDNHRTVKEYFGDSVLYFDQTKSAAEIAATIDGHVSWIKSHPREASEMARRAHAIFLQHFTTEKELVKIAQMHEYILSNMKK